MKPVYRAVDARNRFSVAEHKHRSSQTYTEMHVPLLLRTVINHRMLFYLKHGGKLRF